MKRLFYLLLFIGFSQPSFGQTTDVKANYEQAFDEMYQMLKGTTPLSFKRAVFLTENAYLENQITYDDFQKPISALVSLTKALVANDGLDYKKKDRQQVLLAGSIYRVMKDTLVFENPDKGTSYKKYPYTYDTADFWGANDWTKMFVTKLLYTQSGNCHSLPLLYKILADEVGAEAWLSITPNHTYIKQWNDKTGWYNTELTSGRFPYDAEIKNNSYIKTEAIVAGVYMDTLTPKENISYAITDLAQGYVKKFGYEDISIPVKWLDTVLVYYPDFPNALILRAELLKKSYESIATVKGEKNFLKPIDTDLKRKFEELEKSYYSVHLIEYRRMPKEMYLNWLYRVRKNTTRKPHRFESPQPFKDYGYKVLVMTASDGYNYEFYDQEDTTRIGTVIINRLTGKIVNFIEPEKDDFSDEIISRMYDPYVGRFWQIDPHSESYYDLSPYSYANNNPIVNIDPDGQDWYRFENEQGQESVIWREGNANEIEIDGAKYANIGAIYNHTTSEGITIIYEQNEIVNVVDRNEPAGGHDFGKGMTVQYENERTNGVINEEIKNFTKSLVGQGDPSQGPVWDQPISPFDRNPASKNLGAGKGSSKNSKHANERRRDAARQNYEQAKKEYEDLKRKPNKSSEDAKKREAAKRKMEHYKRQMDFTGENHSQKNKGN